MRHRLLAPAVLAPGSDIPTKHTSISVSARSRRRAVGGLPAGLLALGLMVSGCGERQESPLAPGAPNAPTATGSTTIFDSADRAAKERNAVNLGPPTAPALGPIGPDFLARATLIPFAPKPGPFAHQVPGASSCDDCVAYGLPIGFSFTFYGNTYTTFDVSSNGFIGFSSSISSGCCSGQPIPSNDGINNIIAAAWTDLTPGYGGGVFYETRGQAPNRYLIVAYQDVPWCCSPGNPAVTTQIVLYEGTNTIDINTTHQPSGHTYTQGVEDANGAFAGFIPGRVAANYTLTDDAVRFTTSGNFWTARASLPSARHQLAVTAAGGRLYAIGGLNSAGAPQRGVFAYNPSTNSWSTKPLLPAPRYSGNGAAAISGKIYVAGGLDLTKKPTRALYVYNSTTNTWATRAAMPAASGCGGSAVIGGNLYVFSGCTLLSNGAQVNAGLLHRYNPSTNTWTTLRSAPQAHFKPVVAAIGNRLYVAGGDDNSGTKTTRVDMYDPTTNTWVVRASMLSVQTAAAGAVVGGLLYVAGGFNGAAYLGTVEAYNPVTDTWVSRMEMPTPRAGLGASLIGTDGRIYAVGGRNAASVLGTNARYTP